MTTLCTRSVRGLTLAAISVALLAAGSTPASAETDPGASVAEPKAAGLPDSVGLPLGASAYRAVTPVRIADSRQQLGFVRIDARTFRVTIPEAVDVQALAATVTITAVNASGPGFVTAFPAGTSRPNTSNLNIATIGATIANTATVRLSDAGAIDLFIDAPTDLIVDLLGLFVPSGATGQGRLVQLPGTRVFDSRNSGAPLAANDTVTITLPGDIPADAAAAAINLTFTDASGPGYFAVWAAETPQPTISTGNADKAGQTRAISALVPLSPHGLSVYTQAGAHVIVDVVGYITGESAAKSADGLFVPATPERVLDTRSGNRLAADGTIETPITVGAAIWANLTSVDAKAATFATAYASGTPLPATSNLNTTRGTVIANAGIVALSDRGFSVRSQSGEHLLVDTFGYFTGSAVQSFLAPPSVTTEDPEPGCEIGVTVEIDRDRQRGRLCDPATGTALVPEFPVTTRTDRPNPGRYQIFDTNIESFAWYPSENTNSGAGGFYNLPYFIGFAYGWTGAVIGLHAVPRTNGGTRLQTASTLGTSGAAGNRYSLGCVHIPDDVMPLIWQNATRGHVVSILN